MHSNVGMRFERKGTECWVQCEQAVQYPRKQRIMSGEGCAQIWLKLGDEDRLVADPASVGPGARASSTDVKDRIGQIQHTCSAVKRSGSRRCRGSW